jgi:hypothetical protein
MVGPPPQPQTIPSHMTAICPNKGAPTSRTNNVTATSIFFMLIPPNDIDLYDQDQKKQVNQAVHIAGGS